MFAEHPEKLIPGAQIELIRFNTEKVLEEALVNAVFHKSYREEEPVEIRIYVDSIQILNYPGLAKWINLERIKAKWFTKSGI